MSFSEAEAEAEGLIRAHMSVVQALIDALVELGTLTGEQVDQIIIQSIIKESVVVERADRQRRAQQIENARKFSGRGRFRKHPTIE